MFYPADLLLGLYLVSPNLGLATPADRISAWTGSHTRLVWVQDQGDGTNTLAHGQNLMLYGYDSKDGRGERPLLPKIANYFLPLITPDGQQVIVSNRWTRQMSLIDWESGKTRELGEGVLLPYGRIPNPTVCSGGRLPGCTVFPAGSRRISMVPPNFCTAFR
jgi:hypothetical protein